MRDRVRTTRLLHTCAAFAATLATIITAAPLSAATPAAPSGNNAADLPEKVTWSGEIAQVVLENCGSCHRSGDIAPMSLQTYDEVRPWAKSMLRAVKDGLMPPWHADPRFGEFKNDRSLTDREVALLERWVDQGAKPGDLAEAPAPPEHSDDWRLGEPDLVLTFEEVSLPAGGPDVFRDLVAQTGLEQDQWLRAVEIKPGNRKVVHHVILIASDGNSQPTSGWLGAWAAGMDPMVFPEGTAKLVPKGGVIVGDMHYHPDAEPARDSTQIGLYFYDGEPEKELINLWVQNGSFKIPAGAADHVVRSSHTFEQDSTVYGLLPHMHYRGKQFTYTATFPDGRKETLLHVDDYDFNWQTLYELAEPLDMPKGTRIDCEAHYDNSADNPYNPDPTRDVTFGNESYDEMMIGFVDYVVKDGQRPVSAAQLLTERATELARAFPAAIWEVEVGTDEGSIETVLHLPETGDGTWIIPMNGALMEGTLKDIVRSGARLTAVFEAPIGLAQVEGELSDDHLSGTIVMGPQTLTFTGHLFDD